MFWFVFSLIDVFNQFGVSILSPIIGCIIGYYIGRNSNELDNTYHLSIMKTCLFGTLFGVCFATSPYYCLIASALFVFFSA